MIVHHILKWFKVSHITQLNINKPMHVPTSTLLASVVIVTGKLFFLSCTDCILEFIQDITTKQYL